MSDPTVKHVIRFPSAIYAKLRKLAEIEDRSVNSEVIVAVKLLVEKYEKEHGSIPHDERQGTP